MVYASLNICCFIGIKPWAAAVPKKKNQPWRAFCPMTHERRRKVIKNGSWKCRWGMCYDFLKRLKPFQMNKAIQIPWRQKSYKNWLSWLKATQKCDCVVKEQERVRNSNKSQVRGGIKYITVIKGKERENLELKNKQNKQLARQPAVRVWLMSRAHIWCTPLSPIHTQSVANSWWGNI